jgi:hypothetical protein
MRQRAERAQLSYAEYLVSKAASTTKHEWLRGEVFAAALA